MGVVKVPDTAMTSSLALIIARIMGEPTDKAKNYRGWPRSALAAPILVM